MDIAMTSGPDSFNHRDPALPEPLARLARRATSAIFDFDGVIADTEKYHAAAFTVLMLDFGIDFPPAEFSRFVGVAEVKIYEAIAREHGLSIGIPAAMRRRLDHLLQMVTDADLTPHPQIRGMLELLSSLDRPIALLSSQQPWVVRALVDRWGLKGFFSDILTAYDVGVPKPELLRWFADSRGRSYSSILLLEDAAEVLRFAQSLGMVTVQVVHDLSRNVGQHADYVLDPRSRSAGASVI